MVRHRFIWTPSGSHQSWFFSSSGHVMTKCCHLLDPHSSQSPSTFSIYTVVGPKYKLAKIIAQKRALRHNRRLKLNGWGLRTVAPTLGVNPYHMSPRVMHRWDIVMIGISHKYIPPGVNSTFLHTCLHVETGKADCAGHWFHSEGAGDTPNSSGSEWIPSGNTCHFRGTQIAPSLPGCMWSLHNPTFGSLCFQPGQYFPPKQVYIVTLGEGVVSVWHTFRLVFILRVAIHAATPRTKDDNVLTPHPQIVAWWSREYVHCICHRQAGCCNTGNRQQEKFHLEFTTCSLFHPTTKRH